MAELTALIDTHPAVCTDPDASRHSAAVQRNWAAQGGLIDPPWVATGHAQISQQADQLLAQFLGHRFLRSSAVDSQRGMARCAWQRVGPTGITVLEGLGIAQANADGRLTRVTGFFGPLPTLEPAS